MCRIPSDGNRSPTDWLYYRSQAIGTQAQVADLLAVTARTVQRRERGANANHKGSLARYGNALSVASMRQGAIRLTPRRTSATSQVVSRPAITDPRTGRGLAAIAASCRRSAIYFDADM